MTALRDLLDFFINQISSIGIIDVLDILLVSVVLYYVFKFIRDRRAGKLLIGVILLIIIRLISISADLNAMNFILQEIFRVGLIALIIVFQPELRSILEKVGAEPLRGLKMMGSDSKNAAEIEKIIEEICIATCAMSKVKTGAIMVIEISDKLSDYTISGTQINAQISSNLLRSIFFDKSPLHDGAVIISLPNIHSAGCFLPLSTNEQEAKDFGARHRAALGISENSDAVVIVVSEETGVISLARNSQIFRNYDHATLRRALISMLIETSGKRGKSRKAKPKK